MRSATPIILDPNQKQRLEILAKSGKTTQRAAQRARILLLANDGHSNMHIAAELRISRPTVILCRSRFLKHGLSMLNRDETRPGRKPKIDNKIISAILYATTQTKPKDATHWSVRSMAQAQGVPRMTVQRIWKLHGLQPHRLKGFKVSNDPDFEVKVRDVVGLYLNPPEKAVVFSVDEKSQIQALDRTQPGLPLKPGRCGTMTHDYKRHGTTTLFAALNMLDGKVIGECMGRHRSVEFLRFLKRIDAVTDAELAVHLVVDNYSTHKSPAVKRWLKRHPRFHFHFTPTGSSWLNMIERWFRDLTVRRIRRGVFHSVKELIEAIKSYLANHNNNPQIFTWTKDAETILAKVKECKEALGTVH